MKIGDTFLAELVAASVPTDGLMWNVATGEITGDDAAQVEAAKVVLAKHDPAKPMPKTLIGNDIVDAMTEDEVGKARRKDMLRLSCDEPANCLKSKVKRVADAIGTTPELLAARATPTG